MHPAAYINKHLGEDCASKMCLDLRTPRSPVGAGPGVLNPFLRTVVFFLPSASWEPRVPLALPKAPGNFLFSGHSGRFKNVNVVCSESTGQLSCENVKCLVFSAKGNFCFVVFSSGD